MVYCKKDYLFCLQIVLTASMWSQYFPSDDLCSKRMTEENNIQIKATIEMAVELYRNSEGEPLQVAAPSCMDQLALILLLKKGH